MRLYIARHGQTKWNTEKRMQGWENSNLTYLGNKQAERLGRALSDIDFKQVISSPLGRTIETSKHIIGKRPLDLKLNDNFKEMGFGSWEGQGPEILMEKYPVEYNNLWTNAEKYVPIDGESFQDLYNRVIGGFNSIIEEYKDGNILLVTHGMVIQVLLLHIKGLTLKELWSRKVVHPASLTIVDIKGNEMSIVKEDDISHLRGL